METQSRQIEDLQDLQESLELQRRQTLATILEDQDADADPDSIEKSKMKLALVLQELRIKTARIKSKGRNALNKSTFESPKRIAAVTKALKAGVSSQMQGVLHDFNEAIVKLQVLEAREKNFKEQSDSLAAEIASQKEEVSRVLCEGGDPSGINLKVRAKSLELEDLAGWLAKLETDAIPEAKKRVTEAENQIWKALLEVVAGVKPGFIQELNDLLAQAAEIQSSWSAAVADLFREYTPTRPGSQTALTLPIDNARSSFGRF